MRKLILACLAAVAIMGAVAAPASADVDVHDANTDTKCSQLWLGSGQVTGGCPLRLEGPLNFDLGPVFQGLFPYPVFGCTISASGRVGGEGHFVFAEAAVSGPRPCADAQYSACSVVDHPAGKWGGTFTEEGPNLSDPFKATLNMCLEHFGDVTIEFDVLHNYAGGDNFPLQLFSSDVMGISYYSQVRVRGMLGSPDSSGIRIYH
ncbi:MAG TPA: hypothetical protein VHF88_07075 [Thermoleophilaceae bacterium]|nr:hypothetical protein [Thermoleophilaceae bacterium]